MVSTALSFAMLSHPGRVRQRNEDACSADRDHGVFVVCDGVGGAAGGEVASQLAAKSFIEQVIATRGANSGSQNGYEAGIASGVEQANKAVHTQASSSVDLYGMATTMVAMLIDLSAPAAPSGDARVVGTVWFANIGDSRCYRLRQDKFEQLTRDHSVVEEQVLAGAMTREEAENSPIRNVITRAIGSDAVVEPDIHQRPAWHGDLYLLTSDGLMRELRDSEIAAVLHAAPPASRDAELAAICQQLIDEANRRGGGDNITCLLVHVH